MAVSQSDPQHSATCSGCPFCNAAWAEMFNAFIDRDWSRYEPHIPDALREAIAAQNRSLRANTDGGVPKPPSLTDLIRGQQQPPRDEASRLPEPRPVPKRRPLPERMPSPPSLSDSYRNTGGAK